MIIWRGLGCLAIPVGFAAFFVTEIAFEQTKGEGYYEHHGWAVLVASVVAAVAIWILGRLLNNRPGRVLVDKASGKEFIDRPSHDLFFIPVQWWAIGALIIGIVAFFKIG